MILDIYLFDYEGNFFCYDAQNGNAFRTNSILNEVLEIFHMNPKDIMITLSKKYSSKEILYAIAEVYALIRSELIHVNGNKNITFDHCNIVSLKFLYYDELTPSVEEIYKKLKNKYHDEKLLLIKNDNLKFKLEKKLNEKNLDIEIIETFLKCRTNICHFKVSEKYGNRVLSSVSKFNKKPNTMMEYLSHQENRDRYPEILSILKRIYNNYRKIFPCVAGIDYLFIDRYGMLYSCQRMYELGYAKGAEELGCVKSVFDLEPCCECCVRFLCGGFCHIENKKIEDTCIVIKAVMGMIIKCSVYIEENYGELKTIIKSME